MSLIRQFRRLYQTLKGEAKVAILLFHRVSEVKPSTVGPDAQIAVSPSVFAEVMQQLVAHFQPLSLPDAVDRLRGGNALPQRSVAVTFDDGFRDTLTTALPILEEYDVPATCYITSGFVDGSVVPYEYGLSCYVKQVDHVELQWNGKKYQWRLDTLQKKKKCYHSITSIAKPLCYSGRRRLLESLRPQLYERVDVREASPSFMTPSEVAELAQHPLFTIGGHTHRHLLLSSLDHSDVRAEIQDGLDRLQEMVGSQTQHFSYPYGGHTERIAEMVSNFNLRSAVTTQSSIASAWTHSVHKLPRMEIKESSTLDNLIRSW
jgi:peptidoglycan/xylan/chitin deacetylase (PgdA/CDA1 family)